VDLTLTMVGRLDPCVLLAYSTPVECVRALVPAPLELVTRDGRAFWHVVACRVERMRPAGLPALLGMTYAHVAYRLAVKHGDTEGLFFVRSDVDSACVSLGGNLATDFRFHASPLHLTASGGAFELAVDGEGRAQLSTTPGGPLVDDPLLSYRPVALSVRQGRVIRARVERDASRWREHGVRVDAAAFAMLDAHGTTRLERAAWVEPIDYRWNLGGRLA
jgi:hypothetical protein